MKYEATNKKAKDNLKELFLFLINPKYFDFSDYMLLLSNLAIIYYALTQGYGIATFMWIYYCQGIIICIFTIIKIKSAKNFSTKGFTINGKPVEENNKGKLNAIIVFVIVLGMFNLIYLVFLFDIIDEVIYNNTEIFSFSALLIPIIIFFINHLFSLIYNYNKDKDKKQNIGEMISIPTMRIFPMHITIVIGAVFIGISRITNILVLIFFLTLKVLLDLLIHRLEHDKGEFKTIFKTLPHQ